MWPSRFPSIASATPYARNPEALANKVYGGRMGNTKPGEGWRYRGRGFLMITGRDNYVLASGWSGFDLTNDPDLAAQPATAAMIAGAYWDWKHLNALADADDLDGITKAINGGRIGFDARKVQLGRAKVIFA